MFQGLGDFLVRRGMDGSHGRSPQPPQMSKQHWLVSGALVLLCGGVLVLFTDVETSLVRWVNCGPLSSADDRQSRICR